MQRFYIGLVMIAAGLVALDEAQTHRPPPSSPGQSGFSGGDVLGTITLHSTRPAWSRAVYDLVSFGGWMLLIVGVVVIVRGLLARARDLSDPPTI